MIQPLYIEQRYATHYLINCMGQNLPGLGWQGGAQVWFLYSLHKQRMAVLAGAAPATGMAVVLSPREPMSKVNAIISVRSDFIGDLLGLLASLCQQSFLFQYKKSTKWSGICPEKSHLLVYVFSAGDHGRLLSERYARVCVRSTCILLCRQEHNRLHTRVGFQAGYVSLVD